MSPLLGEIKRGGETILSSPVGEGWKGWGTLNQIPPKLERGRCWCFASLSNHAVGGQEGQNQELTCIESNFSNTL